MAHKAILIDVANRTVTEIEQPEGLRPLYEVLSVPGVRKCDDINAVMVTRENAMYVDGEGMLIDGLPTFSFLGSDAVFAGNGLIVGTSSDGDDVSHTLKVDDIREKVVFLELATTGELGPSQNIDVEGFGFVHKVGEPKFRES